MSDPRDDGAITAEERGDTSVTRTTLTRSIMVLLTVALVVGIVVTGNLLAGNGATPWAAASPTPSAPSPSEAATAAATPAALDGGAGGMTSAEDVTERVAASTPALIVAAVDGWLTGVSRLAWDDPRALTDYGTVILSARDEPYGLGDLIASGAVRQDDATTLSLVRPVVVRSGARLQVDAPGTTLRMLSTDTGFTELVGWGGTIALNGAEGEPFVVTSWDENLGAVDTDTSDGRGFVLVRNGRFESSFTRYEQLGFWSGRTGGVAVTATDVGLASAALSHTEHVDLAFGVFLSGVIDSSVTSATVLRADLSGIEVTGGSIGVTISDTAVDGTGRDGITVEQGSSLVAVTDSSVARTAAFGLRITGAPLANGPNPSGEATTLAAGFTVSGLTATDNESGGITVDSGNNVLIDGADVDGTSTALAIRGEAHTVSITDARLTSRRSVPLVIDGDITDAKVTGSTITGSTVGVRVDDARIALSGNTVTIDEGNAIQLAGTDRTTVTGNTIIGIGQDAVQIIEHADAVVADNDTAGWDFRPEALQWLNRHPMAWLWLLVLVVPAVGAPFILARRRDHRELRHLLEEAIVRYGLGQLAAYGTPGQETVPATVPGAAPATGQPSGQAPRSMVASAPAPRVDDAAARAATFRAELASRNGVAPASPVPHATPVRSTKAAAATPATARPPLGGSRPSPGAGSAASPGRTTGPRSLQDLRALLAGRDFTSMQQFAVAAVLEAGYPASSVARLFRVPAWRIEQWVEETLADGSSRARQQRGR
ncbi:MAG: right-handed parallel beta-helix repeat-containing protein [Microbacterium sp.]|uniref:right-handed parallel beta-helix repeat-containing protein n=1 Tax=Microbacterium sp. TaxID=51671 RepID=UPI0026349F38|nr:right-handed parallel beta-helix repeat-containing protein [Microbacterium sp.]MCX6501555.1 right-handed parallel beta-helix repeat-containing protein [Microbacterium sp.]